MLNPPIPTLTSLPPVINGFELSPDSGWISVIIPEYAVNLVTNPSIEIDTTGYTGSNTTLTRDSAHVRRGLYALKCVPGWANVNAELYYTTTDLVAANPYYYSLDLYASAGDRFELWVEDTGARVSLLKSIKATGYWQRISVGFTAVLSVAHKLYLNRVTTGNINPFWVDGVQLVQQDHDTTYIDGDISGDVYNPSAFFWNGTPHASTSTRSRDTGLGGREVNLLDYGLRIMAIVGLGMGQFSNVSTALSSGGGFYQKSLLKERQFSLIGAITGTLEEIQRNQQKLISAFDPAERTPTPQLMKLRYHKVVLCTDIDSAVLDIPCVYDGGLEGNLDNFNQNRVAVVFHQYIPLLHEDGDQSLIFSEISIASANRILMKSAGGSWSLMGTGLDNVAYCAAVNSDGILFVGGAFINAGGVGAAYIAMWSGGAWHKLTAGAGLNGAVSSIVAGPNGEIWIGGVFSTADGATARGVVLFNNGAYAPLTGVGTNVGGAVYALAVSRDLTRLYLGGIFDHLGAVAAANVGYYDFSGAGVWVALGSGTNGDVLALTVGLDNRLYVGGSFLDANGVAVNNIGYWNGITFVSMQGGANAQVSSLTTGNNGLIYASGAFTVIGLVTNSPEIASWNGTQWSAMGSGITSADIRSLNFGPDNRLYIGLIKDYDVIANAGGLALPSTIAVWTGSAYTFFDLIPPLSHSTNLTQFVVFDAAGNMYVGFNIAGDANVSQATNLSNDGKAVVYAQYTIKGPGNLFGIYNYATGDDLVFNGLTVADGETLTLNSDPNNFYFVSSVRGDVSGYIGANAPAMAINPGINPISVFMANTGANTKAYALWHNTFKSIDGATR